jgi:hypothetical protein
MKITKEHKADIIRSVLAFKFRSEERAIEEGRKVLGEALYEFAYGAHEVQVRALPKGWVNYTRIVQIDCDGFKYDGWKLGSPDFNPVDMRHSDKMQNLNSHLPLSVDRPRPACMSDNNLKVKPGHPLWKQAWGLVQRYRKMQDAREELRSKTQHLLSSVNTLKQLQEAWPEGERFFPKEVKNYAVVPVGLSHQINEVLGIPEKTDNSATKAVRKAATTK